MNLNPENYARGLIDRFYYAKCALDLSLTPSPIDATGSNSKISGADIDGNGKADEFVLNGKRFFAFPYSNTAWHLRCLKKGIVRGDCNSWWDNLWNKWNILRGKCQQKSGTLFRFNPVDAKSSADETEKISELIKWIGWTTAFLRRADLHNYTPDIEAIGTDIFKVSLRYGVDDAPICPSVYLSIIYNLSRKTQVIALDRVALPAAAEGWCNEIQDLTIVGRERFPELFQAIDAKIDELIEKNPNLLSRLRMIKIPGSDISLVDVDRDGKFVFSYVTISEGIGTVFWNGAYYDRFAKSDVIVTDPLDNSVVNALRRIGLSYIKGDMDSLGTFVDAADRAKNAVDEKTRAVAMSELAKNPSSVGIFSSLKNLNSQDAEIRAFASRAIEYIAHANPDHVGEICKSLFQTADFFWFSGEIEDRKSIISVFKTLTSIDKKAVVSFFDTVMDSGDGNEEVAVWILAAVGSPNDKDIIDIIINKGFKRRGYYRLRLFSIYALGRLKAKKAVPAFLDILKESERIPKDVYASNEELYAAAAIALGYIGVKSSRVIRGLRRALEKLPPQESTLREEATELLRKLQGKK